MSLSSYQEMPSAENLATMATCHCMLPEDQISDENLEAVLDAYCQDSSRELLTNDFKQTMKRTDISIYKSMVNLEDKVWNNIRNTDEALREKDTAKLK